MNFCITSIEIDSLNEEWQYEYLYLYRKKWNEILKISYVQLDTIKIQLTFEIGLLSDTFKWNGANNKFNKDSEHAGSLGSTLLSIVVLSS